MCLRLRGFRDGRKMCILVEKFSRRFVILCILSYLCHFGFVRKNRKRKYMTNVTTKLGVEAYETPSCSVVEICFEGVLCTSNTSGGFSHQGIDGDDESIF